VISNPLHYSRILLIHLGPTESSSNSHKIISTPTPRSASSQLATAHLYKMHRTYSMRQSRAPTQSQLERPPPPPSSTKVGRLFGGTSFGLFTLTSPVFARNLHPRDEVSSVAHCYLLGDRSVSPFLFVRLNLFFLPSERAYLTFVLLFPLLSRSKDGGEETDEETRYGIWLTLSFEVVMQGIICVSQWLERSEFIVPFGPFSSQITDYLRQWARPS